MNEEQKHNVAVDGAGADAAVVWFENDHLKSEVDKGAVCHNDDGVEKDYFDREANQETESEKTNFGNYPADCYTFMSLHGPFDKTLYFYFGFLVWAFQVRPTHCPLNQLFRIPHGSSGVFDRLYFLFDPTIHRKVTKKCRIASVGQNT